MENSRTEALLMKANDNRNQLIETIVRKIEEIKQLIENINNNQDNYLIRYLKSAQEYDVNYVPDKNVVQEFLDLISKLDMVLEKLKSLSLTEETIFEEEKFLIGAEKVTDEIDFIIKAKKQKFMYTNREKFEEAYAKKTEIEVELSNIEFDSNLLDRKKEELEEQNYKLKRGIVTKKKKAQIEENEKRILEIKKEKTTLEERTTFLKLKQQSEHFVPVTESQEDEKDNEKDEDKAIE